MVGPYHLLPGPLTFPPASFLSRAAGEEGGDGRRRPAPSPTPLPLLHAARKGGWLAPTTQENVQTYSSPIGRIAT
jgi:hypothetical protein